MIAALLFFGSPAAHAGDTVTVEIGDQIAEVDILGVFPIGVDRHPSAVTSSTLTYTGVGSVQIRDAQAGVAGDVVPAEELTLLPSGDAQLKGTSLSPGDGGGVQLVAPDGADATGLLISADEATMADVVSTTGSATTMIDGVQRAYGSTTLAGDREALRITADFSALGVERCRVMAGTRDRLVIDEVRPCDAIGTVHGDGLSFKHFNTDYHEHDYGHYWTWGGFVFNVYLVGWGWVL